VIKHFGSPSLLQQEAAEHKAATLLGKSLLARDAEQGTRESPRACVCEIAVIARCLG